MASNTNKPGNASAAPADSKSEGGSQDANPAAGKLDPTGAANAQANLNPVVAQAAKGAVAAQAKAPELDPSDGYRFHVKFNGEDIYTSNERYVKSLASRGGRVRELPEKRS